MQFFIKIKKEVKTMTNKSNVQFVRKVRTPKPKTTTHKENKGKNQISTNASKQKRFINDYTTRYNAIMDGSYSRKYGYENFPNLFTLDDQLKDLGFSKNQRNYFWDEVNKNQTSQRPDNVWNTLQKYSNLIND